MSSSPKYSAVALRAEEERRQREEQARREEEERQRRAAEEERLRRERIGRARADALQGWAALDRLVADFGRTEAAAHADRAELGRLAERSSRAKQAIEMSDDEPRIHEIARELRDLEALLPAVEARAHAAMIASHLAREGEALAAIRALHDGARALGEKFDREGFADVASRIQRALAHVHAGDLGSGRRAAADVGARLARHQALVRERFSRWDGRRAEAVVAVDRAGDRVMSLRADAVVARRAAADVSALEERLRRLGALIEGESFDTARADAADVSAEVDRIVARAYDLESKEARRQYIADGLRAVMTQLGFEVRAGAPPEGRGAAVTPLVLEAHRGDEALTVRVPQRGPVEYEVSGFEMRAEPRSDGGVAATCDGAEEAIEEIRAVASEQCAIELGAPSWEGKDPDRPRAERSQAHRQAPAQKRLRARER